MPTTLHENLSAVPRTHLKGWVYYCLLDARLFSNDREKERVWVWVGGKDLGAVEGNKFAIRIYYMKKSIFN